MSVAAPSTPDLRGCVDPGVELHLDLPPQEVELPTAMTIEPTTVVYKRVMFDSKDESWDKEMIGACQKIEVALAVRRKWIRPEVQALLAHQQTAPCPAISNSKQ